jgi:hypothetical protein
MEEWQLALQMLSISARDGSNSYRKRDSLSYLNCAVSFLVVGGYCWNAVSHNNGILGESGNAERDGPQEICSIVKALLSLTRA